MTAFVMYYLLVNRPVQSLGSILMMLAGLALYYVSQQFTDTPASSLPVKADALDRA